jgi:uncharacterized membrane protein YhaH (DUF805 family)
MALCSSCGNDIFGGKVCYKCGTRVGGFVGNSPQGDVANQQQLPPQTQFQSQPQYQAPVQQPYQAASQQSSMGQGMPRSMGFSEAVKYCLSNYANFNGRAKRSEYWYFVLFAAITYFAAALLSPGLYAVAFFALIIPTFAAGVRRLHDVGRSGWNILWSLVPLGGLVVLVWLTSEGQPGLNKYSN